MSKICRRCWPFGAVFVALCLIWVMPAPARAAQLEPQESARCYQAIETAHQTRGTPRDVLLAITLTETGKKIGRRIQPWPWTVNMEGKGFWFPNRQDALTFVRKHFDRGARSFDVGCFQINYKWHHQHFESLEAMFDPQTNALYAARFLNDLYREKGNWSEAAGAYHSRTPKFATRYAARFDRYLARAAGRAPPGPVLGHGSEPAPVQAAAPAPAARRLDYVRLGRSAPALSSGKRALGSLAAPMLLGRGLLTRNQRAPF